MFLEYMTSQCVTPSQYRSLQKRKRMIQNHFVDSEMNEEIIKSKFNNFKIPIISNVKASPCNNIDEYKPLLLKQITNTVKWRETILSMEKEGVKKIFEVGPGNVLTGLVKRTTKNIECFSIQNPDDMDNLK